MPKTTDSFHSFALLKSQEITLLKSHIIMSMIITDRAILPVVLVVMRRSKRTEEYTGHDMSIMRTLEAG